MLVARELAAPDAAGPLRPARLVLAFSERSRSRLQAALEDGTPLQLALPRGTVLRDGDRLACEDGSVVAVASAPEPVMEARSANALTLTRIAYHLGNRHAHVEIGAGFVRFAADAVLGDLCVRLGAVVERRDHAFEPEAGAYAAGHHAHSGEARHAGIIHDMQERVRGKDRA